MPPPPEDNEIYSSPLRRFGRDIVLNWFLASSFLRVNQRVSMMRRLGMQIGKGTNIEPGCWFSGRSVSTGEDSYVNYFCQFDAAGSITIGSRSGLAREVFLMTTSHELPRPGRLGDDGNWGGRWADRSSSPS